MANRFGPEESLKKWARHVNDLMDEMLNRQFFHFRDSGCWQPATNVYESPEAFFACVDLAGVNEDDIVVDCERANVVRIRGTRAQPRPAGERLSVHLMEIEEGRFEREIHVTDAIDVERVEARYSKGFLWITMPRRKRH